ncbi:M1 family metallopeptidase [Govanella unica]|uniref:Aminopeptidase n=1 Tax=Govanella unica TaxID=2975056 RepID=A0A9X3TWA9_9PROT|nr:M1 family metallopeptidase [Govania unica]MDA5192833.1 M1 family metallopeptidase [Govania unica]
MLRLPSFVSCLALTLVASSTVAAPLQTSQLPRDIRPDHYDLTLTPDAQNLSFTGQVGIDFEVLTPTPRVVLNAADLEIVTATLAGRRGFAAPKITLDTAAQTATFEFTKALPVGRYRLDISYKGKIGTQATGLFALDYDEASGKRRALYTQFEDSYARYVLPSWDEPFYKATFSVKADVPAGEMAVSNMPVASETAEKSGRKLVSFATSPKMSTYLLFFGLGEFERATRKIRNVEVGVIAKKGDIDKAGYALDSAAQILPWLDDYFAVPYPLPKLDNIAAPGRSQFFSAMENWGAIFTFENTLLFDPAISSESDKQRIFVVEAHEMAHQWFGNLVTMAWWDDLWLNEGFASWMEGRVTEHFHPEWDPALDAVNSRDAAMSLDALASTHPVVQKIETVAQISQAFDAITYQKGQAVIGMLEAYTGTEAWRAGVRKYIKANSYGNTVSDDLWAAVEAAAGKPVTAIAHDFTLQPGVPLIRVESAACKNGQTELMLSQGEYTKDRPNKTPLGWHVPVLARGLDAATPVAALVVGGRAEMTVPGCAPVVVNAGQSGYYRTLYTPGLFKTLAANFARLAPADQMGLLSDSSNLGLAGLQPPSDVFDLLRAIPADAKPHVWSRAASLVQSFYDYGEGNAGQQAALRKFAGQYLRPVLDRLGWTPRAGEPDTVAILRGDLITTLGRVGDPVVIAEARRRFAARVSDPAAIPPSLRRTILRVVALHADQATWTAIHEAAAQETSALIRPELYNLLAVAKDETLTRQALALAMTDEPGVTTGASMIRWAAAEHPDLVFDFAVANKDAVNAKVDVSARTRFIPSLGAGSSDPAMIAKLRSYGEANIPADAQQSVKTAIAAVAYRIDVRKTRMPVIAAWLARNKF